VLKDTLTRPVNAQQQFLSDDPTDELEKEEQIHHEHDEED